MADSKKEAKIAGFPLLLFLMLVLGTAAAGWIFYLYERAGIRRQAGDYLSAIADLKDSQILDWRKQLLADAETVSLNPFNALRIRPFLEHPRSGDDGADIHVWMESLRRIYGFLDVILTNKAGESLLWSGSSGNRIGSDRGGSFDIVFRTCKPYLTDFHNAPEVNIVHLDLLTPVLSNPGPDGKPQSAGILFFRIDPNRFLFPLIQSWPTPSATAETLLVRREGDDVLFLNELRHRKNTALTLRIPVSEKNLPAAMVVSGREGVVEGVDYRGVSVLAAVRHLPDTSWYMIAKIDHEEIFAPLRRRTMSILIIFLAFVGFTALLLLLWQKRREAGFYRKQLDGEQERHALVRHYTALTQFAHDVILLSDENQRIIDVNDRAQAVYGYTSDEMKSLFIKDLRPVDHQGSLNETLQFAEERGGLVYETMHKRKDGTTFPVEVSLRIFNADGQKFYQAIIRDITERKKVEEQIRESLHEKEVLLREVHHRVKNNMQIMSSLLNLQARNIKDEEIREMFRDSQERIRSMALVHEKLYQTRDLSRIDFSEYIRSLVSHLFHSYEVDSSRVRAIMDLERVSLDINTAIPCGLILNELTSNAVKHAFREGMSGEVRIELKQKAGGRIVLSVRDDGQGLPDDFDLEQAATLGLQIVKLLSKQLDAVLRVESRGWVETIGEPGLLKEPAPGGRDRGTAVTLEFGELRYKARI